MVITPAYKFRIRIANSREEINHPVTVKNAYYTGNEKVAVRSAIADLKEKGVGAWAVVDKEYNGRYSGFKAYENIENRLAVPRNFG